MTENQKDIYVIHKSIKMFIDKFNMYSEKSSNYTAFLMSMFKAKRLDTVEHITRTSFFDVSEIKPKFLKKYLKGYHKGFYIFLFRLYHQILSLPESTRQEICSDSLYSCYRLLTDKIPPHGLGIPSPTYYFVASLILCPKLKSKATDSEEDKYGIFNRYGYVRLDQEDSPSYGFSYRVYENETCFYLYIALKSDESFKGSICISDLMFKENDLTYCFKYVHNYLIESATKELGNLKAR